MNINRLYEKFRKQRRGEKEKTRLIMSKENYSDCPRTFMGTLTAFYEGRSLPITQVGILATDFCLLILITLP